MNQEIGMEKLFFELLQVAIGNRKSLSRVPTAHEWGELYTMATRQALVGVCFVAIQKTLSNSTDVSCLPELLRLKWLGMAAKIQQRNGNLTEECKKVVGQFTHDGLQCCVLKGLSNKDNYVSNGCSVDTADMQLGDMRMPGDIDLWCTPFDDMEIAEGDSDSAHYEYCRGMRGVIEYGLLQARIAGKEKPTINYYHTDLGDIWKTNVELHHRPTCLFSPLRNHRLKRWIAENEQFGLCTSSDGLPVPTNSFNAVYQLLHIFKHLLEEGIGLRQLMDYYFVLRALHIEQGSLADRTQSMAQWAEGMGIGVASNIEIMHTLDRLGMGRFASAVMWVLQEVFAMPEQYMICPTDEKEGKFLLNEIMQAGNFGAFDQRIKRDYRLRMMNDYRLSLPRGMVHAIEKTKHNMRLVRHYPEEVMWEPFFRVYHWLWRRLELWRF